MQKKYFVTHVIVSIYQNNALMLVMFPIAILSKRNERIDYYNFVSSCKVSYDMSYIYPRYNYHGSDWSAIPLYPIIMATERIFPRVIVIGVIQDY